MLTWWSWITLLNCFRTHRWMLVKSQNISAIRAFTIFRESSSNAMVSAQPDILRKIEKESCSEQFNSTARNWLLFFVDVFDGIFLLVVGKKSAPTAQSTNIIASPRRSSSERACAISAWSLKSMPEAKTMTTRRLDMAACTFYRKVRRMWCA